LKGGAAGAALLASAVTVLALVDPHTAGRYPSCPWHAVTGTWCPGCGGLRAVHDLTHGHLVSAVHSNVLVVLLAPALLVWWYVARWRAGQRPAALVLSTSGTLAVVLLLAVFTIARNLPAGSALAP
jgi:hypothetical protein